MVYLSDITFEIQEVKNSEKIDRLGRRALRLWVCQRRVLCVVRRFETARPIPVKFGAPPVTVVHT